ncbi:MAG: hypothetical protein H6905_09645 [Hyphomicrobiales bacterium]|nr:hypothetical protein [Hyphomicrobiales bacterium]
MDDPRPISRDLQTLALMAGTSRPSQNSFPQSIARGQMANSAVRLRQRSQVPPIPDPIRSELRLGLYDLLPDIPDSNAPRGDASEYAPDYRPTSAAKAVTALDEPWSPTQSQNTMDQGITGALAAQGQGATQQGLPLPKPRPENVPTSMGNAGGLPAMQFDPAAIRSSLGMPATENTGVNHPTGSVPGGGDAQQSTAQQYRPPTPSTRDLLFDMAMSGRQDDQRSQTGNMENIALALMKGGFNTMANASKPNANAIGSFGEGNTQGLKALTMLNQLDQRNQRYKNQDHLGALRALANIENAQATRDNTAAYQDAMLRERGADRDLRRQIYEGNQSNQAAQLASIDAYRQAMLEQRAQELAATQDGVTAEMKRFQWIQERALKEAQLMSQETGRPWQYYGQL